MPIAKIYQPTKTAMQSGKVKTRRWKLEFTREAAMTPDPLMGWNTMNNTAQQVQLWFNTQEEALAYAKAKQIDAEVVQAEKPAIAPKAYAENFAYNRRIAFDKSVKG